MLLLSSIVNSSIYAQPASASTTIYDWTAFDNKAMLELFYNVNKQGRKFPTKAELANFNLNLEFARSHVRPGALIVNQSTQVKPAIDPKRKLWLNLPVGVSKMNGGYPTSTWRDEVFSLWPYVALQGGWNHSWFHAPGAYMSAAHKHGTDMLSGLVFFDSGENSSSFVSWITTWENGDFKYAEPLINLLMFMGQDGINLNVEGNNQVNSIWQNFHARCYEIAAQKGFNNFHVGYYTNYAYLSAQPTNLWKNGKRVSDALMLNYSASDFADFQTSVQEAEALSPTAVEGLYGSTWIVSLNRTWTNLVDAPKINICLWGEHDQSRIYSYGKGKDDITFLETYQERLERFMSGGNRNLANTPPITNSGIDIEETVDASGNIITPAMTNFHGLGSFVAERSTVKGKLPFYTNFNLGNGIQYNYKGKKTFGQWYNLGAQDMMPTYRWLLYNAGTTTVSTAIQPKMTYQDSYTGGSALELNGTANSTGTDIILYRTDLEVEKAITGTVAFKMVDKNLNQVKPIGTATNLALIVKANNNWYEFPLGSTTKTAWETKDFNLSGIPVGAKINNIGLRVKSTSSVSNYQIFVGEIRLAEAKTLMITTPKNLVVEVKDETTAKMSVKMNWEMNAPATGGVRTDYGLTYNDEINVDHFEIFYKNGASGAVKEIGRTNTWSHFTGKIYYANPAAHDGDADYEHPFVGVRAVSIDGTTVSPIVWKEIPREDYYSLTEEGVTRYCASQLDLNSAGASVAQQQRYLVSVTTTGCLTNLNYTSNKPVADGTNYVDYTSQPIKVNAGQTFDFKFLAAKKVATVTSSTPSTTDDGMRYTFGTAYADWNNNGVFDLDATNNEMIFNIGESRKSTLAFQTTGVTKTFTVPATACPGKVRIRLVFSDAWFPVPGPCGYTNKGFTMDIGMEIVNPNPPATCGQVVSFRDQGEPDLPYKWDVTDVSVPVNKITTESAASKFYPNPVTTTVRFENTQEVWIYTLEGKLAFTQKGGLDNVNLSTLSSGMYLVKMLNNNVIRTAKLQKK